MNRCVRVGRVVGSAHVYVFAFFGFWIWGESFGSSVAVRRFMMNTNTYSLVQLFWFQCEISGLKSKALYNVCIRSRASWPSRDDFVVNQTRLWRHVQSWHFVLKGVWISPLFSDAYARGVLAPSLTEYLWHCYFHYSQNDTWRPSPSEQSPTWRSSQAEVGLAFPLPGDGGYFSFLQEKENKGCCMIVLWLPLTV